MHNVSERRRTWGFDSPFHINFLQAGGFQAKVPSVIRRSRARTGGCYKNLAPIGGVVELVTSTGLSLRRCGFESRHLRLNK